MALTSTVVTNQNTTIISGTAGKIRAVTCLFFCNTHASNADTITVYAVPGGGTAGDDNTIVKTAEINATDTLTFDTEKLLLEACLELMAGKSIISIQDMGAAGLTSSSIEMASKGNLGIELNLNKVPCREEKMTPHEQKNN